MKLPYASRLGWQPGDITPSPVFGAVFLSLVQILWEHAGSNLDE
jgi:hypothetical protein